MKVMKAKKQILSCVLTVLLLAQAGSTAFAAQPEKQMVSQGGVKVEQIADNALSVTSEDGTSILTVDENSAVRTVTITDSKTGHKEYMRFDKKANTLYSSITGETIKVKPISEMSDLYKSQSSYSTQYISYAQIQRMVGYGAKAAAVIGAIVSLTPAAEIGEAITRISDVVEAINSSIHASSNHGIRLTIKKTRYFRPRGTTAYKTTYTIVGASRY